MNTRRMLLTAFRCTVLSIVVMGFQQAAPAQTSTRSTTASKPAPSYNVTGTIHDFDSLGVPLTLQSDDRDVRLNPTNGYGVYDTRAYNKSGNDHANVWIASSEDFFSLRLLNTATRYFRLTLNPLPGYGPAPFSGTEAFNGLVVSTCFDPTGATLDHASWFNITESNPNCSMRIAFSIGKVSYLLVMSPNFDAPESTGRAVVSCTGFSADGRCSVWTILPNMTQSTVNPNPGVANLYDGDNTFLGQYYLTYSLNVTYP